MGVLASVIHDAEAPSAARVYDTAGMIAFLDAQEKAKPGPVGCVGHCTSGSFVATVAARFPTRMAAEATWDELFALWARTLK